MANFQIINYIKSLTNTKYIYDSKNNKIVLQNVIFVIDENKKDSKIGFLNS